MSRREFDPFERDAIRERVFSDAHKRAEGGGPTIAAACLAIAMFLLVGAYSIRQITEQSTAVHIITESIRTTTDVERLIDEQGDALRAAAEEAEDGELLSIPNYPLPVNLEPEEVLTLNDQELEELVLARSAAIVYVTGLSPFDQTGEQSIGFLTVEGMLDQLLGMLTGSTHSRAGWAAFTLLLVATGAGAATLAMTEGFRRFRAFGFAVVLASLPGWAGAWVMSVLVGQFGGSDPYWTDLRALANAMLDVSQRNFLIVGILGLVVAGSSFVLQAADRWLPELPTGRRPQLATDPPMPLEDEDDQDDDEDPDDGPLIGGGAPTQD